MLLLPLSLQEIRKIDRNSYFLRSQFLWGEKRESSLQSNDALFWLNENLGLFGQSRRARAQSPARDESESVKLMQQSIFRLIWHKTDLFHQLVFSPFFPFLFFNFKKTIFPSLSLSLSLFSEEMRKVRKKGIFCLKLSPAWSRWILSLPDTSHTKMDSSSVGNIFQKKAAVISGRSWILFLPPSWIRTHPWIFFHPLHN